MIQPWLQQVGANPLKTYTWGHDLADQALEAIDRIQKYVAQGRATFEAEELIQAWIVHLSTSRLCWPDRG